MAANVKNYGLPEGFTLDEQAPPEQKEDYGLPEGFTLDKPKEKPQRNVVDKASRLVTQGLIGGIQSQTAPFDIAAIASSKIGHALTPMEQRQNLLDDLEYYDEKKSQGIFTPEDQKHYDQTLDLLKNPDKAEKFLPKQAYHFDVGSIIEQGAKQFGVDLSPEDTAETAARWMGFIKNPEKAIELLKNPTSLANQKEIVKALLPSKKEFARGISVAEGLQYAADAEFGPIGTLAVLAATDLSPSLAEKSINLAKNPKEGFKAITQGGKEILAKGVKAFTPKDKLELQRQIIQEFRDAGIQADAGTITGSNLVKHVQNTLNNSSLSGKALENFQKKLTQDIVAEYEKITQELGHAAYETTSEAGEALKAGLEESRQLDLATTRALYKNARELGGSEEIFAGNVGKKIQELKKEMEPGALKSGEQKTVQKALETLESDFLTPAGDIRSTAVDALINNKIALNDIINYEAQGGAKQLLKGVVKEIDDALLAHGKKNPEFAKNWKQANERFSEHAKLFRGDTVKQALLTGNPEHAFRKMNTVHGIKEVEKALSHTADGRALYKKLVATKLEEMIGKNLVNSTTQQLNFGSFSKLLQKGQNRALVHQMLGTKGLKTLEKLQKISGRLAESNQKFLNTSKTAYHAADAAFYFKIIHDMGHFLAGNPWPIAKSGGAWLAIRQTSKMLADPKFLELLEDVLLEESKGYSQKFKDAALKLSERGQELSKEGAGYLRESDR